jgi:predicted acetyltransferase
MGAEIRTIDQGRRHRRECVVDGQAVSWLAVIDYQVRVGSARVRIAGIGDVETHRKHRNKGYMRLLLEDTLDYMVSQDYDVSMLFGISGFYSKFGYAVCLPEHRIRVQTRDAEEAAAHARERTIRPAETEDMRAIVDLCNRNGATRLCSVVRNPEDFGAFPMGSSWSTPADALVVEDEDGGIAAYAAFDRSDTAVNVTEVESTDESLFPTLLCRFAGMAVDRRCERITLFMPPDHPFAEYVQRFG